MTIRGVWQVDNGDRLGAARAFLHGLFENDIVSALLVPMEGAGASIMPSLVKDPVRLAHANPFAPVMALNSARLVSTLTREATGETLGAVLRSCEMRALIELAKFNQVRLDKLVLVGVDCLGTYSVPDYSAALKRNPAFTSQSFTDALASEQDEPAIRPACRICERPSSPSQDISIGFIGVENSNSIFVEVRDDIAEKMNVRPEQGAEAIRDLALARLTGDRKAKLDKTLDQFRTFIHSNGGMKSYFADCLECTNCMNACPICYCKECFFRTANAEHAPRDLYRSAARQGAITMPTDAVLFQMTRLNHMATSCVGCGMCEAACPHDIPLTVMFRAVGRRVQHTFNYVPGANVNDKPPFMLFQQNELLDIGEAN